MNEEKALELMHLFIRAVNRYNSLGKRPVSYGTPYEFHHSERHMIDAFGDHPGKNVTELAELLGVTKGAISQVLARLESKNAVRRYKLPGDDKATFASLTGTGRRIYEAHRKINMETVRRVRRRFRGVPEDQADFVIEIMKWIGDYLSEETGRKSSEVTP